MRLRLKEKDLENIILETDGFYDTLEWENVPIDKMAIFSPSDSPELLVAFNKFQFDDLNKNMGCKRAYIVPKQVIEHLTSGSLTYCINYENRISIEVPSIEKALIEEVQRKLDNNTLLMFLMLEQSNPDKIFNVNTYRDAIRRSCEESLFKELISFDKIEQIIKERLEFIKFVVRNSLYTEKWPEPFISLSLTEIISKVLANYFGSQIEKESVILNFYKTISKAYQNQ